MVSSRSKWRVAQKLCANWSAGNCLGCMIKYEKKYKKLTMRIDSELAGKPCVLKQNKECQYFDNIVIRGIV
jgi:hypothetical protein